MSSRLIGRTQVSKTWGKRSNRLGSAMTHIVMPNSKSGSNPEGSSWQRGWVNQTNQQFFAALNTIQAAMHVPIGTIDAIATTRTTKTA